MVYVDQSCFRERLAHLVHVETQSASFQLLAFAVFVVFAFLRFLRGFDREFFWNHHHTVIVGDDHVAGLDVHTAIRIAV